MSNKEILLYSDTFGDKKNPAIILNAGVGNQGITWSEVFCKHLSEKGYFVIRYDYRDTGQSSIIDHNLHPYDLIDLAEDSIAILRKFGITQAHYVGYSMGGAIAALIAAYFPQHAFSLILIGTSSDFSPGFNAFEGKPASGSLTPPNAEYVKWATRNVNISKQSLNEKIKDYVRTWKILDGHPENFDEHFFKEQARTYYTRSKILEPFINHAKAMKKSYEAQQKSFENICMPTLIIHGGKDPVFGLDHGKDLHVKIKKSKLVVWNDFAHAISPQHFDRIINQIDSFIKENKERDSNLLNSKF